METKKQKDTIKSLETGINIINIIEEAGRPLTMTDIQERTGITKSNLYKYMNTLIDFDLVHRSGGGYYHLGSQLVKYGMSALGKQDSIELVTPYLQRISEHCRNTTLFSVITSQGPVVAKIWNTNDTLNIGARIGTLLPPNSSTGKIFSTYMENGRGLEAKEKASIMSDNIAFASEPIIESISSVSIPVFTYGKELVGIITVVGFHSNLPQETSHEMSGYLLKVQEELNNRFGYRK